MHAAAHGEAQVLLTHSVIWKYIHSPLHAISAHKQMMRANSDQREPL